MGPGDRGDRFRHYLDSNPALVVVLDRQGRIAELNPAGAELLGIEQEAAIGSDWFRFVPEEQREETRLVFDAVMRGDLAVHGTHENDVVTAPGERRTLLWRNAVIRDEGGNVTAGISTGVDVTERNALAIRLAESDRLYRTLFNAVPVGVVLVDGGGRIVAFNDRAASDLGYSREEFAGLAIWDIDPVDDQATVQASVGRVLGGEPAEFDVKHRNKAGELRDVRIRAVRVDREKGPGILATWEDTTERRRMEEAREALAGQLLESQKLESIGRLAGGVAHDLNNILVVLLGCAEGLRRSLQDGRAPEPEDVEELEDGAGRARELTAQLLSYARRRVVTPERLDLNEQVRQAERMLRRLIGEDVELTLRLEPGLWPVTFDPGQLSQVLVNLVLNARDAMPGGGRLALATRNVDQGDGVADGWHGAAAPSGKHVRLTVEDTGAGIPAGLGTSVFEPFVTTKATGKGTGLGLATVLGIVQQAGGAVRYRSEPGRGTTFEVLLPPASGHVEVRAPAPATAEPAASPGGQVLLVEDDPHVRGIVERTLRQGGYEVLVAASGEEALALLRRGAARPRILLTDVVMQGMNGRELAESALLVMPGLPVLFMSGYAQGILVRHGTVAPGLQLIEKPFTGEDLLERVRGLIAPG